MPEEIERLTVAIETNLVSLLQDVDKAVDDLEDGLKKVDRQADKAFDDAAKDAKNFGDEVDKAGKKTRGLGKDLDKLASGAKNIGAALAGAEIFRQGIEFVDMTTEAAIRAQAEQFNLAASVNAASREFGDSVGTLQSWEQNIEGLNAQLQTFGDDQVANATARLVDMTKRLGLTEEEMTIVLSRTADLSAGKIDLADGVERVTAALRGEAESAEFLGLSLNETTIMNYAEAQGLLFKELSDTEKAQLRYNVLLEQTNQIQGRAAQFANTLAGEEARLNAQRERAVVQIGQQLLPLRQGYTQALTALAGTTQKSGSIISDALAFITASFVTFGGTATAVLVNTGQKFSAIAQGIKAGFDAIIAGDDPFEAATPFFEDAAREGAEANEAVLGIVSTFKGAFNDIRNEYNRLAEGTDDLDILAGLPPIEAIQAGTIADIADAGLQQDLIRQLGIGLIDEQKKINAELEDNQQDHIGRMAEIDQAGVDERLEINEKFDQRLNEQSAEIRNNAVQELAELERDTDQQLEDLQEDGQIEETRRLEDHLENLRRIRRQHLDDLEGIVANRDARALVDARRNFARQQQEENENFERSRSRENEDLNRQIDEVREAEQQRGEEILRQREADLQELIQTTEDARQQELQALDEELATKKQKEITSFNERQTELQGWLQRSLQDIATGLAEQDSVTEEGAQAILNTLTEFFGAGGLIDELMIDYQERQAELAQFSLPDTERIQTRDTAGRVVTPNTLGGVPSFRNGGTLIANSPTLAQFGEVPEMVQFTPLSQMRGGGSQQLDINLNMSGSAPPGINSSERDQIAGVLLNALRDSGAMS